MGTMTLQLVDAETNKLKDSEVEPLNESIADKFPCPEGDIFSLPTIADITNAFNEIAQLPGKLDAKLLEMKAEREKEIAELQEKLKNPDLTKEEIAAIEEQIKEKESYITEVLGEVEDEILGTIEEITTFVESLADILDPYWTKGQTRNWQKEARDAFEELLAEFHTFIPTKIAEFVSKLVPFDFNINVLGLQINILKLVTSPSYGKELQDQIAGKNFVTQIIAKKKELVELTEKQKNPDLTLDEHADLQDQIDKLREEIDLLEQAREKWVDTFFNLIPEEFRQFDGEFGVVDPEAKAKLAWKWIKTEIKSWIQNAHMKAFDALIGIFNKIWKLLGLPSLPFSELLDIMNMDIGALIEAQIANLKEKFKQTKAGQLVEINAIKKEIETVKEKMAADDIDMDEHIKLSEKLDELEEQKRELEKELLKEVDAFHQAVKDSLSELSIFGFDILKIIGGEIESTAKSLEEDIAGICIALEDFKMNWHKKILFSWVKIVKKFFSAIGLGSIFEFMFLTWCDFLKIIGMPMGINISLPAITGVIATVVSATESDGGSKLDKGSDEGIAFAKADGEETEYSVSSGTGTVHAFVTVGTTVTEYEHGSGVTISGNTVTFDTAPIEGASVSIIKIAA